MTTLPPPDCDDPTVREAHTALYQLFLTDDAPIAPHLGPLTIYHEFHDWAGRNGYSFPRSALRNAHVRGIQCMDRELAAAVLKWIDEEQPSTKLEQS